MEGLVMYSERFTVTVSSRIGGIFRTKSEEFYAYAPRDTVAGFVVDQIMEQEWTPDVIGAGVSAFFDIERFNERDHLVEQVDGADIFEIEKAPA
jgi:hypothetical protein